MHVNFFVFLIKIQFFVHRNILNVTKVFDFPIIFEDGKKIIQVKANVSLCSCHLINSGMKLSDVCRF